MSKAIPKTSEEKRWQAESDADALIRAAEINDDTARLKAALAASKKMEEEAEVRIKAVRKVSRKRTSRKSTAAKGVKRKST